MAFSTQRLFSKIGFMGDEPDQPRRKRSDGAIKNYDSVTDLRALSADSSEKSAFLAEIIQIVK